MSVAFFASKIGGKLTRCEWKSKQDDNRRNSLHAGSNHPPSVTGVCRQALICDTGNERAECEEQLDGSNAEASKRSRAYF